MNSYRRAEVRAEMLLLAVAVIWAGNYPIAKYGISGLNLYIFNAIRFITATMLIAGTVLWRSGAWTRVEPTDWPGLIRAGLVANVLYQVAFIVGLSLTTAGNSAILLSTAPLWTVVISARLNQEAIGRQVWLGMAASLCGIVMIVVGSGRQVEVGASAFIGDIVCLGAAFLWASNTNLQKPLVIRYAPVQVTLIMVAIGAAGLSLFAISPSLSTAWGSVHWTYFAAAALSGSLAIGASNVLWSHGVKQLGARRTANFGNLIPVIALIISYLTLGERPSLLQMVGTGITIFGVWFARH